MDITRERIRYDDFMLLTAKVINTHGWSSGHESRKNNKKSTADYVRDLIENYLMDGVLPVFAIKDKWLGKKLAGYGRHLRKIIEWDGRNLNDYEEGLVKQINRAEYVFSHQYGYIASVYSNLLATRKKREHYRKWKNSKYVGKIQEFIKITVRFVSCSRINNIESPLCVVHYKGHMINVWLGAKQEEKYAAQKWVVDTQLELKATVSKHTEYFKIKQTTVTRAIINKLDAIDRLLEE